MEELGLMARNCAFFEISDPTLSVSCIFTCLLPGYHAQKSTLSKRAKCSSREFINGFVPEYSLAQFTKLKVPAPDLVMNIFTKGKLVISSLMLSLICYHTIYTMICLGLLNPKSQASFYDSRSRVVISKFYRIQG